MSENNFLSDLCAFIRYFFVFKFLTTEVTKNAQRTQSFVSFVVKNPDYVKA